jgi:UDP-GlcNAc:undecaprenyl-phosphate GlcNAc-1-phosphate transferase
MGITNKEFFLLFVASYLLVGALTPLMRKVALATEYVIINL